MFTTALPHRGLLSTSVFPSSCPHTGLLCMRISMEPFPCRMVLSVVLHQFLASRWRRILAIMFVHSHYCILQDIYLYTYRCILLAGPYMYCCTATPARHIYCYSHWLRLAVPAWATCSDINAYLEWHLCLSMSCIHTDTMIVTSQHGRLLPPSLNSMLACMTHSALPQYLINWIIPQPLAFMLIHLVLVLCQMSPLRNTSQGSLLIPWANCQWLLSGNYEADLGKLSRMPGLLNTR